MFRLLTLFLVASIVVSCNTNTISPEESALLHTACGVKDPLKELSWLKTIIDQAENGPDRFSYAGTIQMVAYQDQTYFIYQRYIMSCMACLIYDCQGNQLDIAINQEKHRAIVEQMSEKKIIYKTRID
jgi:hypothetical protein